MKIDIIDCDQQPATNGHLPGHRPDTDRIATGYGSDNSRSEIAANSRSKNDIQPVAAINDPKNPSAATAPLDLIRQLIPTSLRKRKFRADSFAAKLANFDILEADTPVDTAPMREALSLLLHTRIMTYVRPTNQPRLHRSRPQRPHQARETQNHIAQRPSLIATPRRKTTCHKVDVQITAHPGAPTPITIHAMHETVPTSKRGVGN